LWVREVGGHELKESREMGVSSKAGRRSSPLFVTY
jgi:hypothetical protein